MELADKVKLIVEDVIKDSPDVEIVDLTVGTKSGTNQIRVLVDKPKGILLDECAKINKLIGQRLDEEEIFKSRYNIEVCSPGLDRILKTKRDFERVVQKYVKLITFNPIEKNNVISGLLVEVGQQHVRIVVEKDKIVDVDLNNIKQAKLEVRW
jgi:ribosome maturation factor RimP